MLPLATIHEIRRLLDEGELSQRKIARQLHVSRGTVNSIATGRRGIYGRETTEDGLSLYPLAQLPERCLGCGARVYMPCVLCKVRHYIHLQQQFRDQPPRRVA